MRSPVKKILIGTGVLFGAIIVFMALLAYRFSSETKLMSPLPTKMITDGIYALNDGFVNMYIVKKGDMDLPRFCGH